MLKKMQDIREWVCVSVAVAETADVLEGEAVIQEEGVDNAFVDECGIV